MRRLFALAVIVAGAACGPDMLPLPPTTLETGIVIYEHANFIGASAHLTEDIPDLRAFDGPCRHESGAGPGLTLNWNDCLSSVRVAPGWTATLYRDDNYRDDELTITEDVPNLQLVSHDCPKTGLNDCVTSIRVQRLF